MERMENTPSRSTRLNRFSPLLITTIIGLGIIISIFLYYRPSSTQGEANTLPTRVYFAENITPAHRKLINTFNQKYAGKIEVIAINLQNEKFTTNKRKTLITRNLRTRRSKIDLFSVDQIWIPRFAKWAENLQPYFNNRELQKMIDPALSTCTYKGKLPAVPFFIDAGVMYFRKDLIQQLPNGQEWITRIKHGITWEEMIDLKRRYFKNRYIYIFQGLAYEGLICNFTEICGGNDFFNGQFVFNNTSITRAGRFLHDLIYKYKISPPEVTKYDEPLSLQEALEQDVPFVRGWPTTLKTTFVDSSDREKLKNFDVAPLPHLRNIKSVSALGGWNIILSRYSESKKEAITFLKFLVSPQAQEIMYVNGGHLPILKQFYKDENIIKKFPNLAFYGQLIKNGVLRPADPDYTRYSDIYSAQLNQVLLGNKSIDDALHEAHKQELKLVENLNRYTQK